jgi:hypothetical protein
MFVKNGVPTRNQSYEAREALINYHKDSLGCRRDKQTEPIKPVKVRKTKV